MKNRSGFPPSPWERVGVRLLLLLLLLCSCDFRELTYEEAQEGIPFRVSPDWSALGTGDERPQYVKALFFPVDGGKAVERFVSPDGEEVRVPPGEYRVIVYNWRTNAPTQTVQFRGDTYDTFEAYVAPRNNAMTGRTDQRLPQIPTPDLQLYAWNTGDETILISETSPTVRTRATEGDALPVPMRQMVHSYVVAVNVSNTQYLSGISAVTTDAYNSVPLGGGTPKSERYAVETPVEKATDGSGLYYCRVATFGLFDDGGKTLMLDVVNTEGSTRRTEVDIAREVTNVDSGAVSKETPQVVVPPESPIVVPVPEAPPSDENSGFTPPTLGDWIENDKDIFM